VFVCDGGPEFKGTVCILLEQHSVTAILSTSYHPEGNGIAEQSGQTLSRVLLKCCGDRPGQWPLYVQAALLAIQTTTSREQPFPSTLMDDQSARVSDGRQKEGKKRTHGETLRRAL
jgi:hypothetical protein